MRTVSRFSKSTPSRCSMKVVTKCWRDCSPSLTISMPASCCSCSARLRASRLPSASSSPCSFHSDQSVSGCASQEGLGKLPAVAVGNIFFIIWTCLNQLKGVTGGPPLKEIPVRSEEAFFRQLPLFASQAVALFPVVNDAGDGVILVVQAWLVACAGDGIGVGDLRAADLRDGTHHAARAG